MTQPRVAPFGTWKSPISSDLIVSETIGFGDIVIDGSDIYWSEMRPAEGGRYVIVRRTADGQVNDILPAPFNARTRVHEYGGASFTVSDGIVYFSNFADQHLYRFVPGETPQPVTHRKGLRYADGIIDRGHGRLLYVREDHTGAGKQAVNTLVSLALDGSDEQVLVSGNDFYSTPRLSPDGMHLAWLTWNHPNMPWDGTELWVGKLDSNCRLYQSEHLAGNEEESIFQPEWSPANQLYFVSDRTGWWNLYKWENGQAVSLQEMDAEFGQPQWVFGQSSYGFVSANELICSYIEHGVGYLARLNTETKKFDPIEIPYTTLERLKVTPDYVIFLGGSATLPVSLVQLSFSSAQVNVLRLSSNVKVEKGYISTPRFIEFPTENGLTAFAFLYMPQNQDFLAPDGERPPLLVKSHGGPTGASTNVFNLNNQYWTSRGIAVLSVNYGGSTGFGRAYRQRLNGQWGIVDMDDCVNGAKYLVKSDLVDENRLMITGGSAGGYTTLCALTFRNTFKAGASYYGLSDLEADLQETHKYESHYSDRLVGPYPERRDLYRARSPINFTDQLSCPIIFFQGLEDKIVLPNQSEMMVEALRAKKLPVAYLPFEGEQHGFRRAENIKRSLEAEYYFYARIFGFEPADSIEPVLIENL